MTVFSDLINNKMLVDTHIHPRPDYSSIDVLEKYLKICSENRIYTVGFVEHGKRSTNHKSILSNIEEMNEFKSICLSLQEKWNGKINILCGVEIDYFEDYKETSEYLKEIERGELDFVIGAIHGKSLKDYKEYLEATINLICNYKIDVLGHMQFVDGYKRYNGLIEQIFKILSRKKIFFEINMAKRYKIEPRLQEIKQLLDKYEVKCTWGSDAHGIEEMDVQALEQDYKKIMEDDNIK